MSEGQRFLDKCLEATVAVDPWPYQILNDTLSSGTFDKLKQQCIEKFNFETNELHHIFPRN